MLPVRRPWPLPASGDASDHTFAGRATPFGELRTYALVDSARAAAGGMSVGSGGGDVRRDEAGEDEDDGRGGVEVGVDVDGGAGFSAGTYTPPNSGLRSGRRV